MILGSKTYPRVLVISVNPLSSTSNNGKTYSSFFLGYPKEKLAQLYFHREIPTSDVCENYFKISDEDLIRLFLGKRHSIGKKVTKIDKEERLISNSVNNRLKGISMFRFLRSLLWMNIKIDIGDVKEWLDDFDPEVIFFSGGNANYLYNNVLKISEIYNAKLIYYITDDYILPYFSFDIFNILNRIWTKKVLLKMVNKSSLVFTIGDKMSKVYFEKFGIRSKKIMNLVEIDNISYDNHQIKNNNLKFVYLGGLHSNRWKVLSMVGESLSRISKLGFVGTLEIYSQQQPDDKVLNSINIGSFSKFCGSLDSYNVKRVMNESDIVVHVESFDKQSKIATYLSVSTKIPEYMNSGRCILGIGPNDVASIEYLDETKSGFIISSTSNRAFDENLINLFQDTNKRKDCIYNAFKTVNLNHDIKVKRKEFQNEVIKLGIKTDN